MSAHGIADCEDALIGAFFDAARGYAAARRDAELARAFFDAFGPFTEGGTLAVRLRDPGNGEVRAFLPGQDEAAHASNRVDAAAVARAHPQGIDVDGWALVDGFASDDPARPRGVDLPVIVGNSLVAVVSLASVAAPGERVQRRLARFGEQLAEALVGLAERSETARLRLYAGSIVDRTNVPIAVMGDDGHIRLSNHALRSTLGTTPDELAFSSLLDRIDARDRNRALAAHTRAFRGRSSVGIELGVRNATGGEQRLLVDFEPIPLPSGEIDSVLVVGRDVTRVRQLEEQVTHADRLATLGQLAAGVVHELNNPLTSILVYTEYVLRKAESRPNDDGDVEKLRRVLGAAERIQEFARNLVTYARSERGERELLSITQVLDQAIAFCEPLLDRKHVVLTRDYSVDVPLVPAVRGQLQQIFINLMTNGIHAAPEMRGRIHLAVSAPTPSWVEIRIEDNGPGVPDDRREEIFRPFVTSKPSGQGTGLGLSIVRNLVERHGGTIEARGSELGGASFVLSLPVKPNSERPPPGPLLAE